MKKQFKQKMCFLIFSLLLTISSFAQEEGGGDVDDLGTPATPIDNWIPIMIVIGIALVYYYTTKRKASTN